VAPVRRPLAAALLSFAALALIGAGSLPASATAISIGYYALTGPGPTTWDTAVDDSSCSSPGSGFSPAYDSTYGTHGDAFDDGLVLSINGTTYADGDDFADVNGNTSSTYGGAYGSVVVSRVDTALKSSPTLRDLVKFSNPTKSLKSLDVEIDTNVGSDTGTVLVATSSGDLTHTANDHWVISNDGTPSTGDPVVTQVFSGKNGTAAVTLSPGLSAGTDCVSIHYAVKVPAGKSRYLLSFLQMHGSNKSAKSGAVPFNRLSSGSPLLSGIPAKVLPAIVNWHL
jgi:hypothetical protein